MTIESTIVDSNRLLTHANAIGCTLERREDKTRGESLNYPLLLSREARKNSRRWTISKLT